MAGSATGIAQHIIEKYPGAIYTHCSSHILTLCITKEVKVTVVQNIFDTCPVIYDFPEAINNTIKKQHRQNLIDISRTSWCQKLTGLQLL